MLALTDMMIAKFTWAAARHAIRRPSRGIRGRDAVEEPIKGLDAAAPPTVPGR